VTDAATRPSESAADGRSGIPLGRVVGVPVEMSWVTLLVIAFVGLNAYFAGQTGLRHDVAAGIASAVVFILGYIASILVHELGHTIAAHRFGIGVRRIRLVAWGGLAELDSVPSKPTAALVVAGAGPAGSALCAGVFATLAAVVPYGSPLDIPFQFLAYANAAMTVLNLVPGNPLDGGRVVAALVWGITGSRRDGEAAARAIGAASAVILLVLGWAAYSGRIDLPISPIWLVYLGAILFHVRRNAVRVDADRRECQLGWPIDPFGGAGTDGGSRSRRGDNRRQRRGTRGGNRVRSRTHFRGIPPSRYQRIRSVGRRGAAIRLGSFPWTGPRSSWRRRHPGARAEVLSGNGASDGDDPSANWALSMPSIAVASPDEPLASVLPRQAHSASGLVLVMRAGHAVGVWRGNLPRVAAAHPSTP
jgi:Zn-dependent protease